jgi:sarcosine oxidase delta subunit
VAMIFGLAEGLFSRPCVEAFGNHWFIHNQLGKKHDKWRKVHECQTFVDIKRKDEKMDERSDDEGKI